LTFSLDTTYHTLMIDELEVLKSKSLDFRKYIKRCWKMNDTTPEIETHFRKMIMMKSGQERLKMGFAMFKLARKQVVASIRWNSPDVDVKEIRRKLFLRFYGQDFSQEDQEKILIHLNL